MLDHAVIDMPDRAGRFAGRQVPVHEVAFPTAYQPDRKLENRIMAALAILTTQA